MSYENQCNHSGKEEALSLTQEQIAEHLGVSTPAVNKWEKGSTYPDITLLPALARLLKTDLNTLMSFQDDLSDVEIVDFVNELDQVVREKGYDTAFKMGIDKIHEYPLVKADLFRDPVFKWRTVSLRSYRAGTL